ncbi:hypothetical protein [Nocardioides jensenii]|uniref:hypothetical protein n=1 Tax=Nocardioides jensenii TaxID=1843 RepID=UPI0008361672|nr:hypothetical protein [Nocardioides jensenii]
MPTNNATTNGFATIAPPAANASMLSARQAAAVLVDMGVTRASARRALLAGVAGPGLRLRGSLLYDERRVRALVRPHLQAPDLVESVQRPCFVARVGEGVLQTGNGEAQTSEEVRRCEEQARRALEPGWHMSWLTRMLLGLRVERRQPMAFIGLVGGFLAIGAEVTAIHGSQRDHAGTAQAGMQQATLTLEAPGAWFEQFAGRHLPMSFRARWTTIEPESAQERPLSR